MGFFFRKSSNDTQENSKDSQRKEEALKGVKEEIIELKAENEKLTKANAELTEKNKALTTEKENLNNQLNASQKQVSVLKNSQQVLENEKTELKAEKDNLTKANTALKAEKENLTTDLSKIKNQVSQAKEEKDKLEQKYAPYEKLEKLYEVFLEVKGCLNFGFVEKTHSAMDLIASVLSDSKYYLESLYNKASQELSDKRSDKGEKLAELFDLLFEYVKDNKFERLKEPSAYDSTCKKLYPEQNTSGKIQRVVLIGYTYDKKTTYCTIVDMGS
ncbi:coiled-coil domain-containing protein [Helicobacter pylori]|uniref:coiled-coil domain-containing protein n=1 Tax=Helicobacter pylori TaxID=210 RepID=UPI001F4CAFD1|nr:hypothetical protein [Helicobacter pylori]